MPRSTGLQSRTRLSDWSPEGGRAQHHHPAFIILSVLLLMLPLLSFVLVYQNHLPFFVTYNFNSPVTSLFVIFN